MRTIELSDYHDIGEQACILHTGDEDIDKYADQTGKIIGARRVVDGDARYIQVCIRIEWAEIWVNEDEYTLL